MRHKLMLASILCAGSLVARADSVTVFNLNATFSPTGSATGTVSIDTTTGVVTYGDITATVHGSTHVFNEAPGAEAVLEDHAYADFLQGGKYDLTIVIGDPTFVGYVGGKVCGVSLNCPVGYPPIGYVASSLTDFTLNGSPEFDISTGTLTPTPEPSGLLLLGAGLLAPLSVVRGRLRRFKR